jgi:hypothetical protein
VALVGRGSRTRQAAGILSLGDYPRLIREAAWPSQGLDAVNSLRVFLFLRLVLGLSFDRR